MQRTKWLSLALVVAIALGGPGSLGVPSNDKFGSRRHRSPRTDRPPRGRSWHLAGRTTVEVGVEVQGSSGRSMPITTPLCTQARSWRGSTASFAALRVAEPRARRRRPRWCAQADVMGSRPKSKTRKRN